MLRLIHIWSRPAIQSHLPARCRPICTTRQPSMIGWRTLSRISTSLPSAANFWKPSNEPFRMSNDFVQDSLLGPAAPDLGWVPAPRYLLRRARILSQLRGLPASELLEIGPGAGMLMQELSARGFTCHALETSPPAHQLVWALSARYGHQIDLHYAAAAEWQQRFPLVMAFEVLEHIEDDHAALRQWLGWLKPGGILLMSVPAHPSQWNAADVWAGHFRRRSEEHTSELQSLMRSSYAVFCLKTKNINNKSTDTIH